MSDPGGGLGNRPSAKLYNTAITVCVVISVHTMIIVNKKNYGVVQGDCKNGRNSVHTSNNIGYIKYCNKCGHSPLGLIQESAHLVKFNGIAPSW